MKRLEAGRKREETQKCTNWSLTSYPSLSFFMFMSVAFVYLSFCRFINLIHPAHTVAPSIQIIKTTCLDLELHVIKRRNMGFSNKKKVTLKRITKRRMRRRGMKGSDMCFFTHLFLRSGNLFSQINISTWVMGHWLTQNVQNKLSDIFWFFFFFTWEIPNPVLDFCLGSSKSLTQSSWSRLSELLKVKRSYK